MALVDNQETDDGRHVPQSTVGRRLRWAREDLAERRGVAEIKQAEIARAALDLRSARMISEWERGHGKPKWHQLLGLAEALEVPVWWLAGDDYPERVVNRREQQLSLWTDVTDEAEATIHYLPIRHHPVAPHASDFRATGTE